MSFFKKKVEALEEKVIPAEVRAAVEDRKVAVDFYKNGFLDGFRKGRRSRSSDKILWITCYRDCERSFNRRFMKKIRQNIEEIRNPNG